MNVTEENSPLPSAHADDQEIGRYAVLLDTLGVGLSVYTPEASLLFHNSRAGLLLGTSSARWVNESGQVMADADLPQLTVARTGHPIYGQIMALTTGERITWLKTNALPILSENGTVRRVLLTLDNITTDKELQQDIGVLPRHDTLTGAFNNREIKQLLENEICRAQRYGTPFTLAQLDIDHFDPLCEQHGRVTGELVLAGVGELLCKSAREMDRVGRLGDDEFLLILPNVRLNDAIIGVERLRALVEAHPFSPDNLHITVSGGVTEYSGENATQLIERTTSLLIHAREAGGNSLCQDVDIY